MQLRPWQNNGGAATQAPTRTAWSESGGGGITSASHSICPTMKLDLTGSKIVNNAGPAFTADGLRTDDNLYLRNATIRGAGELGAVRLPGAHIGGRLHLDGLSVTNDTGTALHADSLHTAYDLFLRGATVRGSAKNGALRLDGAHIGGQADLTGTRWSWSSCSRRSIPTSPTSCGPPADLAPGPRRRSTRRRRGNPYASFEDPLNDAMTASISVRWGPLVVSSSSCSGCTARRTPRVPAARTAR